MREKDTNQVVTNRNGKCDWCHEAEKYSSVANTFPRVIWSDCGEMKDFPKEVTFILMSLMRREEKNIQGRKSSKCRCPVAGGTWQIQGLLRGMSLESRRRIFPQ